jgi:PAS domain S-box-containing protein
VETPVTTDGETIRTLHVDDDAAFAELTAEFLEQRDPRITVVTVGRAEEGLERLAEGDIDCVVSDYDMPGESGIDFLERVRERHPRLPFILFTGKGSEEIASDAVSAGATDYLQKERGTEQFTVLANRIGNAAEKYRTETDLERRSRQHDAVATLGRMALRTDDVLPVFEEAVTLLVNRLDCDYAKVLEREGDRMRVVAGVGWDDGIVGNATVNTGTESQAGYTLDSSEPVVVTDLATESRFSGPDLLVNHGVVSGISVTIGAYDDPWGVLGVHTTTARQFTDQDVTFVQNVANVLAATIENQETEARLRESEARFREMAELSPDGLFRTSVDGEFRYVSPASERLLDYPADELLEMSFANVVAEGSHQDAIEGFGRALDGETVHGLELTIVTGSDERRIVEVSASPVERDGEAVMVQGLARDVTDRRKRERALQQSRERYRMLVEHFPNGGVFLFDDECRFTAAGGAELEEVGMPPEEMVGKTPRQLFPPEQAEALMEAYAAALDGEPQSFEDNWQGRDYEIDVLPIRDADGTVVSGMAVARNVTTERAHERALDRLRERSQALMYTSTVEETVEVAVEAAEEDIGAPLSSFFRPNDAADRLEPLVTADAAVDTFDGIPTYERDAETGTRAQLVWEAFETGEPLIVDDTAAYEPLGERSVAGTALIYPIGDHGVFIISAAEPDAYDETEKTLANILVNALTAALDRVEREQRLKQREERLEQQNERLRRFASVLSHDIRNPLSVAAGRLTLLRHEVDTGSEHFDYIAEAHERIESLIEGLLRFALDEETDTRTEVSLEAVAEAAWQSVKTGDASLVVETDRTVVANRSRLRQLLENLFRNSVEHGSASGRTAAGDSVEHSSGSSGHEAGEASEHGGTGVQSVTHGSGSALTVRVGGLSDGFFVADDGPGIPEAERDRVFQMGYSTGSGTGFGLSIVADIAEEHDWSITTRDADGGGVRFEFRNDEM